jgi:hypothetical protein
MIPDNQNSNKDNTSRRTFIRNVGKTVLSITVVGIVVGSPQIARACGEGVSDSNCGNNYDADNNCGVSSDSDNNCGTNSQQSNDMNCGNASSGGVATGGPNGTDQDEACTPSSSDSDSNCSIAQVPVGGVDEDQSCNTGGSDTDQSCGDCDDNHNTDEHCGQTTTGTTVDSDDLCGHQHWLGGSQDQACSATVNDVGCGTHKTEYGGQWNDPDQNCTSTNPIDMNCSSAVMDSNCGEASNPSTTSPDENCNNSSDHDEACSRYDKDQSCGMNYSKDEACGTTTIKWVSDPVDADENCGKIATDPDSASSTTACIQGGG